MARKQFQERFPHTWDWTVAQIEAAEADPATPQHIRDELLAWVKLVLNDVENNPGCKLYRANKTLLSKMMQAMPVVRDASLDDALDVADVVHSHHQRRAAQAKPAPAWHAQARAEADRLIAEGTSRCNLASKLVRMPKFSRYNERTIRDALNRTP